MAGNINFSTSRGNLSSDIDCLDLDLAALIFNTLEIVFFVVTNVISSITVIINIFALFSILNTKKIRNYKVSFVISQVVSDIIYPFIIILVNLIDPNLATYVIFNFLGMFYSNISFSCTICLSLEKYILFVDPFLHERLVTRMKVYVAVVIVWILSFCLSNPFTECSFFAMFLSSFTNNYHQFLFPVTHCLGLSVLTFIYIHIFIIARRHLREISYLKHFITDSCKYRENQKHLNKRKVKFASFFMAVFATFLILLTPITAAKCFTVIDHFFTSDNYCTLLYTVQLLQSLSFLSNLYIYTWKYPGFAKASRTEYNKLCKWISGCLVSICSGKKVERNAIVILEMQSLNRQV